MTEPGARGEAPRAETVMHKLALHPHVGFGLVTSRPIFLDLRRDRYIALDPEAERYFRAALDGDTLSVSGRDRLLATGLFHPSDTATIAAAEITIPQASLLDEPRTAASLPLAFSAYARVARMRRRLKREPLLAVIEATGSQVQRLSPADREAGLIATKRYLAARSLVPIPPKCLPDSLALREWLGRPRVRPALVFGVRMDPFGAHCWLQCEDLVLNDAIDGVAAFTPVMVLR